MMPGRRGYFCAVRPPNGELPKACSVRAPEVLWQRVGRVCRGGPSIVVGGRSPTSNACASVATTYETPNRLGTLHGLASGLLRLGRRTSRSSPSPRLPTPLFPPAPAIFALTDAIGAPPCDSILDGFSSHPSLARRSSLRATVLPAILELLPATQLRPTFLDATVSNLDLPPTDFL